MVKIANFIFKYILPQFKNKPTDQYPYLIRVTTVWKCFPWCAEGIVLPQPWAQVAFLASKGEEKAQGRDRSA